MHTDAQIVTPIVPRNDARNGACTVTQTYRVRGFILVPHVIDTVIEAASIEDACQAVATGACDASVQCIPDHTARSPLAVTAVSRCSGAGVTVQDSHDVPHRYTPAAVLSGARNDARTDAPLRAVTCTDAPMHGV